MERLKREVQNNGVDYLFDHYSLTDDPENTTYYHETAPGKAFAENASQVREIIDGSGCRRVITGHTHMYFETKIDGITHTTIPSISEDRGGKPDGRVGILDTQTNDLKLASVI